MESIETQFMESVAQKTNYGVVFRTDRFGDNEPPGYDATIEMETFPVWPTLWTKVVIKDGTWYKPEHGETLDGLSRVVKCHGFQGDTFYAMIFDGEGTGFEYEERSLLSDEDWPELGRMPNDETEVEQAFEG